MKNHYSPLSVVAIIIIAVSLIGFAVNAMKGESLQYIWLFPTLMIPIFLFILHFIFRRSIQNTAWRFSLETVLLMIISLAIYLTYRTSERHTVKLPEGFDMPFIAIIYGVKEAPELFEKENQLVPKDGVLLSSKMGHNTKSTMEIRGNRSGGFEVDGFISYSGELVCDNQLFPYHLWYFGRYGSDWADAATDSIKVQVDAILKRKCLELLQQSN